MRIVNKTNGQECSVRGAVSIVCDGEPDTALRQLVTRLLEELCCNADGTETIKAHSLSRILEYQFRVEDV